MTSEEEVKKGLSLGQCGGMRQWVIGTGVVLQVVGLCATGWGARRTWRDFGMAGFWAPLSDAVVGPRRWLGMTCRRLFRRPRSATVVAGSASASVAVSGKGRGRSGFRVMPRAQDVAESIAELDQRTRDLLERLQRASEVFQDWLSSTAAEVSALRGELSHKIATLEQSDRRIATAGIRIEVMGMVLIGLGVVVQWVGSLVGGGA